MENLWVFWKEFVMEYPLVDQLELVLDHQLDHLLEQE